MVVVNWVECSPSRVIFDICPNGWDTYCKAWIFGLLEDGRVVVSDERVRYWFCSKIVNVDGYEIEMPRKHEVCFTFGQQQLPDGWRLMNPWTCKGGQLTLWQCEYPESEQRLLRARRDVPLCDIVLTYPSHGQRIINGYVFDESHKPDFEHLWSIAYDSEWVEPKKNATKYRGAKQRMEREASSFLAMLATGAVTHADTNRTNDKFS